MCRVLDATRLACAVAMLALNLTAYGFYCRFIDHGRYEDQIAEAGLSASHIASTALSVLGKPKDAQLTLSGLNV